MKFFLAIFLFSLLTITLRSQPKAGGRVDSLKLIADSTRVSDTTRKTDSAAIKQLPEKPDTSYNKLYRNPYLPGATNPLYLVIEEKKKSPKDNLFYLVAALFMLLAFVKLVFPKYFQNIFRLFFQPSFRQKQTREQLLQNNLPSLLLNLFFILAAGTYVTLIFQHYELLTFNFFLLLAYTTGAVAIIYIVKYIFLNFSGWVFNVREATGTYIFVVYLINKIIGILLIPFILILAFSNPQISEVGITVSVILLAILFIYRYLISFAPVAREIRVSTLHFFFYICAFEITPLLLIYKVLANYLHRTL